MNLTAPSEVQELLAKLDFKPSKVLGQNFLIDANILKILLTTANLHQEDGVLEVGPGLGVLTEWLGRWSGRVVAIEKDRRLFAHLQERFAAERNIELIQADVMDVDLDPLLAGKRVPGALSPGERAPGTLFPLNKVVANLPYSVASRLLISLTEADHFPEQMVVTVQKEVAERLAAKPGTHDYGLITVLTQLRYDVSIRKEVSPTCFMPPPDVKSAIVNLAARAEPIEVKDREKLKALLKAVFSHRRKQLGTILRREAADLEAALPELGIDPMARPETLSPEDWARLGNLRPET